MRWGLIVASLIAVAGLLRAESSAGLPPAQLQSETGAASAATANDSSKPPIMSGPAVGWVFPVFSDKEGYRLLTLRGSAARVVSSDEIDVTGFSAVVFSGDAGERVDKILLSPEASFYPKTNRASGKSAVRLILSGRPDTPNDDVEVIGREWTYDHRTKKVSIAHDVRVTFHTQLHDILK